MEKMNVKVIKEENGTFLADPQHNYNVGMSGVGNSVEEALEDLRTVIDEAREYCQTLPASSEIEFIIM